MGGWACADAIADTLAVVNAGDSAIVCFSVTTQKARALSIAQALCVSQKTSALAVAHRNAHALAVVDSEGRGVRKSTILRARSLLTLYGTVTQEG